MKSWSLEFFLLIFYFLSIADSAVTAKMCWYLLGCYWKNNYKSDKYYKKMNLTILLLYFTNSGLDFKTWWDYLEKAVELFSFKKKTKDIKYTKLCWEDFKIWNRKSYITLLQKRVLIKKGGFRCCCCLFCFVSCRCHLIQWIRSSRVLNETQKSLSLSELESTPCRVPAGSVLDPALFNISLTTWMTE